MYTMQVACGICVEKISHGYPQVGAREKFDQIEVFFLWGIACSTKKLRISCDSPKDMQGCSYHSKHLVHAKHEVVAVELLCTLRKQMTICGSVV